MRSDIAPGGRFPDYELPDQMGNPRKLSELQGDDWIDVFSCRLDPIIAATRGL